MSELISFYKNKKILITGHTGFKGTWLCRILQYAGADIIGYSLDPPTEENLFSIADLQIRDVRSDIRRLEYLQNLFNEIKPEIVFHLAAQPIVRESYRNPVYTYETNVMGTVNVLECIRKSNSVRSAVIITTDKVYKNNEWIWGYRENEPLDGFDPYSNSKSCAELAVHSYKSSFLDEEGIAVSTARAGNVIGGGDFSTNRIIPDCIRAIEHGDGQIKVRNPYSIRPYQYVLEPLAAYMMIAKKQWEDQKYSGYYNVGPNDADCVTTGELVSLFCEKWNLQKGTFKAVTWRSESEESAPHEASYLKLDSTKIREIIGYKPIWHIDIAVEKIVDFMKKYLVNKNLIPEEMDKEIEDYFNAMEQ